MKGNGPTESMQKIPKLTPELSRFIEGMGMYFANQGIPRIGGRILGLLMIAHWPLSAEDIASILKISRGSVSTNFRLLLPSGMVEKVAFHGDRMTYFVFSDSAMEQRMVTGIHSTEAFKRLVQQGLEALPPKDPSRHHLDTSLQWSDLIVQSFQDAIKQWRARRPMGASHALAVKGV